MTIMVACIHAFRTNENFSPDWPYIFAGFCDLIIINSIL